MFKSRRARVMPALPQHTSKQSSVREGARELGAAIHDATSALAAAKRAPPLLELNFQSFL
eukprot:2365157-Pyramimonas_sp.AAC.1